MNEGYSICFNEWALDKSIKNELGLLLIISSLTAEKGYCFASNKYLSELFETDEAQISKKLAKLCKKGYIDITYEKRGTEIISREIRLSKMTTIVKNDNGPLSKMTTDHCQNSQPTDVKNDKYNIISINNTSNNITSINSKEKYKRESKPTLEEVQDYVEEKKLDVDAKNFYDYFEATNWIDSKGNKVKSWKGKLLTWDSFRKNKDSPKKKRATFADLLKEENDNDEEGNNADTRCDTDSIFEVLSDYTVE